MASLLRSLGWLAAGVATCVVACSNDFDQFEPTGTTTTTTVTTTTTTSGGGTTTTTTSSGGGTTTTTTTATGGSGGSGGGTGGSGATGGGGGPVGCGVGFDCLPVVAAGEYGVLSTTSAACPSGWSGATGVGDGTDPGCSACTCGAPSGGGCVSAHRRATAACGGQAQNLTGLVDGDCIDVNTGASGWVVDAPAPTGGSCAPSASNPLPIFDGTVCTAAAGQACGAAMVCVPSSGGSFGPACNLLQGDVACPAGWTDKTALFTTVMDNRNCDCNCGGVQGAACTGPVTGDLYASDDCSGVSLLTMAADGACHDTNLLDTNSSFLVSGGAWSGTSCPAQDNSSGAVSFMDPVTLCCAP